MNTSEHLPSALVGEHAKPPGNELPRDLKYFILFVLVLTALCALVEFVCFQIFHLRYPYTWPLMPWEDPFRDFYLYKGRYAFFHTPYFFSYEGPAYMYPAPLAVVYRCFYFLPHSTWVFLGTTVAVFVVGAGLFERVLVAKGISHFQAAVFVALTFICSYAFFFEFEQANMEIIIWLLVALGTWAFLRGQGLMAAACFGIAGAMKIFPLVFLGLFLSRKQYRETVLALVVSGLTTVSALWLVCPDLATSWQGIEKGLALFREKYALQYNQLGFDHSLFAFPKAIFGSTKFFTHSAVPPGRQTIGPILTVYLPVVALIGILLYFLKIRRLPIVNQVTCLTVASILLPPVSFDYTLMHLYIPWALLVLFAIETRERISSGLTTAFACFAILLSPETEFIFYHHSVGGQIKAVTLVVLMTVSLLHRFPSSYDVELKQVPT